MSLAEERMHSQPEADTEVTGKGNTIRQECVVLHKPKVLGATTRVGTTKCGLASDVSHADQDKGALAKSVFLLSSNLLVCHPSTTFFLFLQFFHSHNVVKSQFDRCVFGKVERLLFESVQHLFHGVDQVLGGKVGEFGSGHVDLSDNGVVSVEYGEGAGVEESGSFLLFLAFLVDPCEGVFAVAAVSCQEDAGIPYPPDLAHDVFASHHLVRDGLQPHNVQPTTRFQQIEQQRDHFVLLVGRKPIHGPNEIIR